MARPDEHEDWDDIRACLAGEDAAYARLVARYERAIAVQMGRFAYDAGSREELTQDVFVEAYFSLPRYRPEAPFEHWLRRIATRVGYQYWKRLARRPRPLDGETADRVATPPAAAAELTPEAAETILKSLLARLNEEDRLVLTLMYFEECSVREIAERTGWNEPVVKMRAHRAREKLRKIILDGNWLEKLAWMP